MDILYLDIKFLKISSLVILGKRGHKVDKVLHYSKVWRDDKENIFCSKGDLSNSTQEPIAQTSITIFMCEGMLIICYMFMDSLDKLLIPKSWTTAVVGWITSYYLLRTLEKLKKINQIMVNTYKYTNPTLWDWEKAQWVKCSHKLKVLNLDLQYSHTEARCSGKCLQYQFWGGRDCNP